MPAPVAKSTAKTVLRDQFGPEVFAHTTRWPALAPVAANEPPVRYVIDDCMITVQGFNNMAAKTGRALDPERQTAEAFVAALARHVTELMTNPLAVDVHTFVMLFDKPSFMVPGAKDHTQAERLRKLIEANRARDLFADDPRIVAALDGGAVVHPERAMPPWPLVLEHRKLRARAIDEAMTLLPQYVTVPKGKRLIVDNEPPQLAEMVLELLRKYADAEIVNPITGLRLVPQPTVDVEQLLRDGEAASAAGGLHTWCARQALPSGLFRLAPRCITASSSARRQFASRPMALANAAGEADVAMPFYVHCLHANATERWPSGSAQVISTDTDWVWNGVLAQRTAPPIYHLVSGAHPVTLVPRTDLTRTHGDAVSRVDSTDCSEHSTTPMVRWKGKRNGWPPDVAPLTAAEFVVMPALLSAMGGPTDERRVLSTVAAALNAGSDYVVESFARISYERLFRAYFDAVRVEGDAAAMLLDQDMVLRPSAVLTQVHYAFASGAKRAWSVGSNPPGAWHETEVAWRRTDKRNQAMPTPIQLARRLTMVHFNLRYWLTPANERNRLPSAIQPELIVTL